MITLNWNEYNYIQLVGMYCYKELKRGNKFYKIESSDNSLFDIGLEKLISKKDLYKKYKLITKKDYTEYVGQHQKTDM